MKKFSVLFLVALSCNAMADDLNSGDHQAILKALTAGISQKVDANKNTTLFLADPNGTMVEIDNSSSEIAIYMNRTQDENSGLGIDIGKSGKNISQNTSVVDENSNELIARETSYFDFQGSLAVFSTTDVVVSKSRASGADLSISVTAKTHYGFASAESTDFSKLAAPPSSNRERKRFSRSLTHR